jgi:hypothetical protein
MFGETRSTGANDNVELGVSTSEEIRIGLELSEATRHQ